MNITVSGGKDLLVIGLQAARLADASGLWLFSAALPPQVAGRWCAFSLAIRSNAPWWAKLRATDTARDQVVREAFFGPSHRLPGGQRRGLLMHVPQQAGGCELILFTSADGLQMLAQGSVSLRLRVLGRAETALRLLLSHWRKVPQALRGQTLGLAGRVRATLGQAASRAGQAPPYSVWIDLFDRWGERERDALTAVSQTFPQFAAVIVADGSQAGLAASKDSLASQWWGAEVAPRIIHQPADWAPPDAEWCVVLAAGEILAPHALACFARAVGRAPEMRAFCSDLDHVGEDGTRYAPSLRPPPDPWLLQSALCASGAWVFHRQAMAALSGNLPVSADAARLCLARSLSAEKLARVPLILTHCQAPPVRLIVTNTLRKAVAAVTPSVSVIIPSACRSRHVLRCLKRLLRLTDYPDFEILLAVSAIDPADAAQAAWLSQAAALQRVRVLDLGLERFNYSEVNNKAASQAKGEMLVLLNDDVVPVAGDWLRRMVAYAAGEPPQADIVGARLLYGNRMIQHAGVIMGLANLCEHGFRLAACDDPALADLARIDRQVSAVTAACLLVRRSVFQSLGGLDEGFVIALNDVDFCLRAGAAGARVVFAAGIDLYHFESLSLGRHYQGGRAALEAIEVRRLRERWAGVIAADPFYNPCASLEPGREFEPGFPPRQTPLSWIGTEAPAVV
jgi:GT2 family glycosyltransferase